MSETSVQTAHRIFYQSKPHRLVLTSKSLPHERVVGDWTVRETCDAIEDSTLPQGAVWHSVCIETDVLPTDEIWTRSESAYALADDLNRVWTYVCGEPLNAARLGLVERLAPPTWTTNFKEVEEEIRALSSGLTGTVSVTSRYYPYCSELPLSRALDILETYRNSSEVIQTLVELHYSALTSERSEARLFFFAKGLEVVRKLLVGRNDQEKEEGLPPNIKSDLKQSLHWLFDMANNRSNVRHVVQPGNGTTLHPRMSAEELRSFEHDADSIVRAVVCMQFGVPPFAILRGKPTRNS